VRGGGAGKGGRGKNAILLFCGQNYGKKGSHLSRKLRTTCLDEERKKPLSYSHRGGSLLYQLWGSNAILLEKKRGGGREGRRYSLRQISRGERDYSLSTKKGKGATMSGSTPDKVNGEGILSGEGRCASRGELRQQSTRRGRLTS